MSQGDPKNALSLGEFLRLNKLTMASFAGLSIKDALELAGLDDGRLNRLGDDHRARCLAVRAKLVEALQRIAPRRAETDEGGDEPEPKDVKDYQDTSEDTLEIDPETGKLRKRKPKAGDDTIPADREDQPPNRNPDPDKRDPASAWNAIPVSAKVFALGIINAGRTRRGLTPLTRLVQDETVLPADGRVPTDSEQFAKAVINAARKARAQEPLKPGEFISIRELRGVR
jgi:hypothetical protein